MGHSRVRIKVRRRKVAALAAYSRQFTVKNIKKGISEVVNHKRYGAVDIPKDKLITSPYSGIQYVMTNPHPIHGEKYGITVTGYDWVPIDEYKASTGLLWEHKKYPQPKSYWLEIINTAPTRIESTSLHKDPVKMNRVQYMEKLVEHKTAKWERKHVCPEAMFTEDVEKWKQERENAVQRFRDFVVSIYDNLIIMGNRVNTSESKMKASKIAEVKDVDGKGHDVSFPNLSTEDKLYKNAESAAKKAMKKDASIIDADLMNHKRSQKRPLVGAKRVTLADKKLKKAA